MKQGWGNKRLDDMVQAGFTFTTEFSLSLSFSSFTQVMLWSERWSTTWLVSILFFLYKNVHMHKSVNKVTIAAVALTHFAFRPDWICSCNKFTLSLVPSLYKIHSSRSKVVQSEISLLCHMHPSKSEHPYWCGMSHTVKMTPLLPLLFRFVFDSKSVLLKFKWTRAIFSLFSLSLSLSLFHSSCVVKWEKLSLVQVYFEQPLCFLLNIKVIKAK